MNSVDAVIRSTELKITVAQKREGRQTFWPVTCSNDCDDLLDIKPPTRERGTWLAQDHRNQKHRGVGAIRVLSQPKAKKGKHGNRRK